MMVFQEFEGFSKDSEGSDKGKNGVFNLIKGFYKVFKGNFEVKWGLWRDFMKKEGDENGIIYEWRRGKNDGKMEFFSNLLL